MNLGLQPPRLLASLLFLFSLGAKAVAEVGAVAEGLVGAAAAAAQARLREARDDATGAAGNLEVAAHLQRAVRSRLDFERPASYFEHVGLTGGRLARGCEADLVVGAVAVRLVFRGSAATERGAK